MFTLDNRIFEFTQLSLGAQDNRRLLMEIADDSQNGLLGRAIAGAIFQLRDLASGASPVDTGTLRSAHRGELHHYVDGIEGVVLIDATAVNPVNRAMPVIYGEIWADRHFNWFESVAVQHGDSILDQMEQVIGTRVDLIWR